MFWVQISRISEGTSGGLVTLPAQEKVEFLIAMNSTVSAKYTNNNKKFELMLTRCAKVSSLAENWGVHAKLIYKYQILYLDRITIVPWHHLANDIDLCRRPKSPKNPKTPYFGIQGH